jgi:hypothetical protein
MVIHTEKRAGRIIEIMHCEDAESPRELDNLGTMICFHRRYKLGDAESVNWTPDTLRKIVAGENVVALPLYLMDHSGLSMSTGDYGDPWDSGQVGYIFATRKAVEEEYGAWNEETRATARRVLESEVEAYARYLRGEIYDYIVKDATGAVLDSCGGIDDYDYALQLAREAAVIE